MNGLKPKTELEYHERLVTEYRKKLDAMGKRNNWRYRDILSSLTYHEEEAAKLRKEIME